MMETSCNALPCGLAQNSGTASENNYRAVYCEVIKKTTKNEPGN